MLRAYSICSFAALTFIIGCKAGKPEHTDDPNIRESADVVEASPIPLDSLDVAEDPASLPFEANSTKALSLVDSVPCIEPLKPRTLAEVSPEAGHKARKRPAVSTSKPKHALTTLTTKPEPQNALKAAEALVDSLERFPWRADQINPLLATLYEEALAFKDTLPDSAMARVNFALRFCHDAAFYALGAEILYRDGNLYRSIVLAERAALFPSGLSPDAAKVGYRVQAHALRQIKASSPSEEVSSRYNRIANAYALRFNQVLEAN